MIPIIHMYEEMIPIRHTSEIINMRNLSTNFGILSSEPVGGFSQTCMDKLLGGWKRLVRFYSYALANATRRLIG